MAVEGKGNWRSKEKNAWIQLNRENNQLVNSLINIFSNEKGLLIAFCFCISFFRLQQPTCIAVC